MNTEELYQRFLQCKSMYTDSRLPGEGKMFFALRGDKFNGNDFVTDALAKGARWAVTENPSLAGNSLCIVVEDALSTLQELANYHRRQLDIPVLAITGTNGKTTTKELIAAVLGKKYRVLATSGNLNNHIGVPLTLLSIKKDEHQYAVIEMGANHPGEIERLCKIALPDYGLITNVGKAHLEGFGSFEGVIQTKGELYRYIAREGKGIFIHADNPYLITMTPENIVQFRYGSCAENVQMRGTVAGENLRLVCKILFPKGWLYIRTNLAGVFNLENVLAAAAVGLYFQVDPLSIQDAIEHYQPSNNRSQIVILGSNTVLVDCYNANPTSMEAALTNFLQQKARPKVVILGDMLELGNESAAEHQKIVNLLNYADIDEVLLVGNHFMETQTPPNFKKYQSADDLLNILPGKNWENRFILLKGSRGIQLEKLIETIKEAV